MNGKQLFAGVVTVMTLWGTLPAAQAQMSVDEIVQKANVVAYYTADDGRSEVKMTITDAQGRVRNREFIIFRKDITEAGEQKYYVYFQAPADVKDMTYMVWKHPDQDDDRWLYLPALDLVRRIAAKDKRSSFVGSNFVYEDISGRSLVLDQHELRSEDDQQYVIRNTPFDTDAVEFSYYDVFIGKDNFLPVKAEYYDRQGTLYKTVEALEVQTIDGYPTVVISKATDVLTGANTVVKFNNVAYDLGLPDELFTERYLRRLPQKWLP